MDKNRFASIFLVIFSIFYAPLLSIENEDLDFKKNHSGSPTLIENIKEEIDRFLYLIDPAVFFKNFFFQFNGRTRVSREEYLNFFVFFFFYSFIVRKVYPPFPFLLYYPPNIFSWILDNIISGITAICVVFCFIYFLILFYTLSVYRGHDLDCDLFSYTELWYSFADLLFTSGTEGCNRFGEDPRKDLFNQKQNYIGLSSVIDL